jgi:inosine-uridine nucleoside N-ribohydrolase
MTGMPIHQPAHRLAGLLVAVVLAAAACGASSDATPPPVVTGEPPTERIPVIVDTDLDVSDVIALAVLLRDPQLDVRAVTITPTGTGVTTCASGRRVARYLLEELGAATIPFACGREDPGPDGRPFPAEWRSDADGGWGMAMPSRPQSDLPEDAVTLLARVLDESPSAPTLVALGPWTNLEDAIAADPAFGDRLAAIHAMAGAIDVPGNVVVEEVTPEDGLEWNLAADPSAVEVVLGTTTPISLVPLDATNDVPVPTELADRLAAVRSAAGADLTIELLARVPARDDEGQSLWDELAALALSDPDLVTWEEDAILGDETGRLRRDEAGRPVRIATSADRGAVEAALVEALGRGPARLTPFEIAGAITVRWDGATCVAQLEEVGVGVVSVTFENSTGDPAAAEIVEVIAPHTWQEVVDFTATLDPTTDQPPEWIVPSGGAGDMTGSGVPATGTVQLHEGTYGPVCLAGEWPDVTYRAGEPFVVAGP